MKGERDVRPGAGGGDKENDPVKLAETGEKQRWSFHGPVFDFECRAAPHKYQLIPKGVQLEMSILETSGGDPARLIRCAEAAIQAGDVSSPRADPSQPWPRAGAGARDRGRR